MVKLDKRGKIESDTLVYVIIAIVSLVMIIAALVVFNTRADAGFQETVCAFSVRVKAKLGFFPLGCRPIQIKGITGDEESVKKQVAELMKKCWWMYGEGKVDTKVVSNPVYDCYVIRNFKISKDEKISLLEFFKFLRADNGNFDRYWDYISSDGEYTVCFDSNTLGKTQDDDIFKTETVLFIRFHDDSIMWGAGKEDGILLTHDQDFTGRTAVGTNKCVDYRNWDPKK